MWIARDKDGSIVIFNQKPIRDYNLGQWLLPEPTGEFICVDEDEEWFCPSVKWSDKEPTEIILKK